MGAGNAAKRSRAVRTRIAPAPTGFLHIGTARTALFNYLFAKKHGGVFVLRIEDTDLERSSPEFEKDIFVSLGWLGIEPDESPEKGGPFGPYRQSERTASYTKYLERLLEQGSAFYCFHTEGELEAEKQELMAAKQNPIHRCVYRDAPSADRERLRPERNAAIIRFKTPAGRTLRFQDLIRGEIRYESDLLGDFSIAKDLAIPLYNFAVVIDDAEMAITHVIRGEDHIPNTPKQMLIQEALGLPTPEYAHLPLILGPDRSKLSKRHGATAIREFREQGYLPEALVNFMALLGWNPGGNQELLSMEELLREFDLGKVQKSGAVFNTEKLEWMNGEYIRRKSPHEFAALILPYVKTFLEFPIPNTQFPMEYVEAAVALEQPRVKKLSDIREVGFFFQEPAYPAELLRWRGMTDEGARHSLLRARKIVAQIPEADFSTDHLVNVFLKDIGGEDKGQLLWPLRAALTGKQASPGPFEVMAVLGKERTLRRIERALSLLARRR